MEAWQPNRCIVQGSAVYLKEVHTTKRKAGKLSQRHWKARKSCKSIDFKQITISTMTKIIMTIYENT